MKIRNLTIDQAREICDVAFAGAEQLIRQLAARVNLLEGVIFEDLHPDSTSDELHREVVEAIRADRAGPECH